jgi:hypothetical protein
MINMSPRAVVTQVTLHGPALSPKRPGAYAPDRPAYPVLTHWTRSPRRSKAAMMYRRASMQFARSL